MINVIFKAVDRNRPQYVRVVLTELISPGISTAQRAKTRPQHRELRALLFTKSVLRCFLKFLTSPADQNSEDAGDRTIPSPRLAAPGSPRMGPL